MGGGRGTRMFPLTAYRAKPAVPLGGRYRLIDIPISNCLNSGFNKIIILTQYASESLNKHIFRTYKMDTFFRGYVEILAADQSYERTDWFQGTADSVRRCLPHIHDPNIEEVMVLSGDQLYGFDLRKFQEEHRNSGADITVACHPEPEANIHHFGIMNVDKERWITDFVEKPKKASQISGPPPLKIKGVPQYMASMGIYIFKKHVLEEVLADTSKVDFGKEIIPGSIRKYKTRSFLYEGYWSDIGTILSYFEANLMLAEPLPQFNLYDEEWQIFTRPRNLPPAKLNGCHVTNSIVAEGCILDDATIHRSVVGVRSIVGKGSRIEESILTGNDYYSMGVGSGDIVGNRPPLGIGKDCVIRKAIIDKNVSVGDGVRIINKNDVQEEDGEFYSIRDGIVVIHKGTVIPEGAVI